MFVFTARASTSVHAGTGAVNSNDQSELTEQRDVLLLYEGKPKRLVLLYKLNSHSVQLLRVSLRFVKSKSGLKPCGELTLPRRNNRGQKTLVREAGGASFRL